jgi:uncharacterized protein YndB with AHSA1/START domain
MSDERVVSAVRLIAAPPAAIFDLLADPSAHQRFDGSGTVVAGRDNNPDRLSLGARFGMQMKMGLPYRITSQVVEFEENRCIAWRHFGRHVWRYQLEPVEEGTRVTESFEWGSSLFPPAYEWAGYPARHEANMARSLEQLATLVESP